MSAQTGTRVTVLLVALLAWGSVASAAGEKPKRAMLLPFVDCGKWGAIDRTGAFVVKPEYAEREDAVLTGKVAALRKARGEPAVAAKAEGPFRFERDEKYGYRDADGKVVIAPIYEDVEAFHEGRAAVLLHSEWTGGTEHSPYGRDIMWDGISEEWGYIDESGKLITSARFDEAGDFCEGLARVSGDGGYGFIGRDGKFVVRPQFREASDFSRGVALVRLPDRWGYIDRAGKVIVKPRFDTTLEFADGMARVELKGKWGYVDASGRVAIAARFTQAKNFSDGLAEVYDGRGTLVIDRTGKPIGAALDRLTTPFSEGLAAVENDECLTGYIDRAGRIAIRPRFTSAGSFSEGLAAVEVEGRERLIDTAGRVLAEFDHILPFGPNGLAAVCRNGKWGYIDRTGKLRIPLLFDDARDFAEDLAPVAVGKKSGYIDARGAFVIGPVFDEAEGFSDGLAAVSVAGKWGFVDRTGKLVVAPRYESAGAFRDGLAPVRSNGKWGFIDRTGKLAIALRFDYAHAFENDLARVALRDEDAEDPVIDVDGDSVPDDARWGAVDRGGRMVVPARYAEFGMFSDGVAIVLRDFKWGVVDRHGKEVVPPKFAGVRGDFSEGLLGVRDGDSYKWGFIDTTGKVVIAQRFEGAYHFRNGIAPVRVGGKNALIDRTGRFVFGPGSLLVEPFVGDRAAASRDDALTWGYIDRAGKFVIPPQFEFTGAFAEGVAIGQMPTQWGFIDRTGRSVIRPRYDKVWDFSQGMAAFRKNGKWGFIDRTGTPVIAARFDFAETFSDGLAAVSVEGKMGYVNARGEMVIRPRFDQAGDFREGWAAVSVQVPGNDDEDPEEKFGLIDKTGAFIVPPTFDDLEVIDGELAIFWTDFDGDENWGYIDRAGRIVWQSKP